MMVVDVTTGENFSAGRPRGAVHGRDGLWWRRTASIFLGPRREKVSANQGNQPDDRQVFAGFRRDAVRHRFELNCKRTRRVRACAGQGRAPSRRPTARTPRRPCRVRLPWTQQLCEGRPLPQRIEPRVARHRRKHAARPPQHARRDRAQGMFRSRAPDVGEVEQPLRVAESRSGSGRWPRCSRRCRLEVGCGPRP